MGKYFIYILLLLTLVSETAEVSGTTTSAATTDTAAKTIPSVTTSEVKEKKPSTGKKKKIKLKKQEDKVVLSATPYFLDFLKVGEKEGYGYGLSIEPYLHSLYNTWKLNEEKGSVTGFGGGLNSTFHYKGFFGGFDFRMERLKIEANTGDPYFFKEPTTARGTLLGLTLGRVFFTHSLRGWVGYYPLDTMRVSKVYYKANKDVDVWVDSDGDGVNDTIVPSTEISEHSNAFSFRGRALSLGASYLVFNHCALSFEYMRHSYRSKQSGNIPQDEATDMPATFRITRYQLSLSMPFQFYINKYE